MDMVIDLTLQDFNPLSKHVKYAQMPDQEEQHSVVARDSYNDSADSWADVRLKHSM